VPAYRHDVSELIAALAACEDAGLAEIIVHDDGTADHEMLARMQYEASRQRIAVRLIAADANRGRASARNGAIAHARADWVLLLDATCCPTRKDFLTRYLDAMDAVRARRDRRRLLAAPHPERRQQGAASLAGGGFECLDAERR
jgi:glycosyltransferase involved in cell wall biosynthesis